MNEYFLDSELNEVREGDFIIFTFWYYFGIEVAKHIQGRIIKDHGRFCFKYKRKGRFSTRRLSALNFDSTTDWLKINDKKYKNNE